jgi:hypothetical protein
MDELTLAKVQNTINELQNQITKDFIDTSTSMVLMNRSVNQLNFLLTHIAYLEKKLESSIQSNKTMAINAENLIAENQRLSQIAKY